MPWSKIDDQFYDHPKIVAAGPLAVALFVCSLSYCSRHLTDGFILKAQVGRLIDVDDPLEVAERLVEVGLWEKRDGGYQVHDYLDYNPSATQIKAQRKANAERQASWRGRKPQEPEPGNNDESNAASNAVTNDTPIPIPIPIPIPDPIPDPVPQRKSAATASPSPSPSKKSSNSLPIQAQVFIEFGGKFRSGKRKGGQTKKAAAIEFMIGKIPDDSDALERWGQVVDGYVRQWSSYSYTTMVNEYYLKGRIPGQSSGDGNAARSTYRTADEYPEGDEVLL